MTLDATSTTRETLVSLLDGYLAALVANDVARAPLAPGARLTENGQHIPFGHALWATATGRPGPRYVDVVDVDADQIATLCVIEELEERSLLGLRLKGDHRGISEIETLVVRPQGSSRQPPFWDPAGLAEPRAAYAGDAPAARDELVAIVDEYLDAITAGDGSKVRVTPDAVRRENGFQTVLNTALPEDLAVFRMSIPQQFSSGFGANMVNRDRRYVVDERRGLVFISFFMEFVYSVQAYRDADPMGWKGKNPRPTTTYLHEVWRVRDGRIEVVDALVDHGFYGMTAGW